jgi:hypothetical protein
MRGWVGRPRAVRLRGVDPDGAEREVELSGLAGERGTCASVLCECAVRVCCASVLCECAVRVCCASVLCECAVRTRRVELERAGACNTYAYLR